jgi:hypothetical protein
MGASPRALAAVASTLNSRFGPEYDTRPGSDYDTYRAEVPRWW